MQWRALGQTGFMVTSSLLSVTSYRLCRLLLTSELGKELVWAVLGLVLSVTSHGQWVVLCRLSVSGLGKGLG